MQLNEKNSIDCEGVENKMLTYKDTTEEQKQEIYNKAFTWRHNFADHVANLIKKENVSIEPSGSDMFKPHLWKACHWLWFSELK